jgi:hypothetical protein
MDAGSTEFNDLLAAWVDALKVMDTKLNAYYSAVASLENNTSYPGAATHFKQTLSEVERNPDLAAEMTEKYRLAMLRLRELSSGSHPVEAVAAWLREYQLEKPKVQSELP